MRVSESKLFIPWSKYVSIKKNEFTCKGFHNIINWEIQEIYVIWSILSNNHDQDWQALYMYITIVCYSLGFTGGSEVKASACNAGDPSSIPELGRSPGEGNSNPLPCSCLENPMEGGAWWTAVHGVAKSRTRLSDFTHSLPQCAKSLQSHPTLCDPMDCSLPGSSVSRQGYWSGLPCPPPGDLPDSGI